MNQSLVDAQAVRAEPTLSEFIRACRAGIDPRARRLGSFVRQAARVGRPVSQEEVSEAIGVTRQWYSLIETRPDTRVSADVLARCADAFMLTAIDRERLFKLALPEIADHLSSTPASSKGSAFFWIPSFTHRLLQAKGETDVFAVAVNQVAEYFGDAPLVVALLRTDLDAWRPMAYAGSPDLEVKHRALCTALVAQPDAQTRDEFALYPRLSRPGDVGTIALCAPAKQQATLGPLLATLGFSDWTALHGRVRSKRGTIASLIVAHPERTYSDTDVEVMSAFADLASLALP